jgi:hypothetical protein
MAKKQITSYYIYLCLFIIICFSTFILLYKNKNINEPYNNLTNIHNLTVYNSPFKKIRLGRENDGGYVIADIPGIKYDVLLSGGVNDDSSFEDMFLNKYNDIECYAFDGTISKSPSTHPKFNFIKKNIGPNENTTTTNLHEFLNSYKNIFLKMDIEGHEIEWLESVSERQLNNISQIAIEFHKPYSRKEDNIFNKLNTTHYLIHAHGNNNSGVQKYNNVIIPEGLELTYINKKYIKLESLKLNKNSLPSALDQKNLSSREDIDLNYPPFVFI